METNMKATDWLTKQMYEITLNNMRTGILEHKDLLLLTTHEDPGISQTAKIWIKTPKELFDIVSKATMLDPCDANYAASVYTLNEIDKIVAAFKRRYASSGYNKTSKMMDDGAENIYMIVLCHDWYTLSFLSQVQELPLEITLYLSKNKDPEIQLLIAMHKSISIAAAKNIINSRHLKPSMAVLENRSLPKEFRDKIIAEFSKSDDITDRNMAAIVADDESILTLLLKDKERKVRKSALNNAAVSSIGLNKLIRIMESAKYADKAEQKIFKDVIKNKKETMKRELLNGVLLRAIWEGDFTSEEHELLKDNLILSSNAEIDKEISDIVTTTEKDFEELFDIVVNNRDKTGHHMTRIKQILNTLEADEAWHIAAETQMNDFRYSYVLAFSEEECVVDALLESEYISEKVRDYINIRRAERSAC